MSNNFTKIDLILDRIRKIYDDIMQHLPKAAYLKRTFEDRYLEALKSKTDLEFFLKGEEEFLESFVVEAKVVEERKAAYKERHKGGYAESMLKEIQAGIADYPVHPALDDSCIKEVSRLYGAIHQFLEHYWEGVAYFMRGLNYNIGVEVDRLERSLSDIYTVEGMRPPKAVETYNKMVRDQAGTGSERIRTAQETIQFAGVWLNNLYDILETHLDKDTPEDIRAATSGLSKIIQDFRLGAFSKRS